jgi:Ca-activated chloride channel family protein
MDAWFAQPTNLGFLTCLPLLILLIYFAEKRLIKRSAILGATPGSSKKEAAALLVISACLSLALARPYWGSQEINIPKTGQDFVLLIDVSRSMLTRDKTASRLESAKRKVIDLIRLLQDRGQSDRLGIVLFSQDSFVLAPLTSDYGALRTYVHALSPRIVTDGGSSLIEGLRGALLMGNISQQNKLQILILSDGEDLHFSSADLKDLLSTHAFTAHAIGVGSDNGVPIEIGSGMFLRDGAGRVVLSKRQREHLEEIAELSGGRYQDIEIFSSDLSAILPSDRSEANKETQKLQIFNEYGAIFCVFACIILALLALLDRRVLIMFTALILHSVADAEEAPAPYALREKLIAGDYSAALEGFKDLATVHPQDPALRAALGSAAFGLKDYPAAAKYFEEQRALEQNGRGAFEALYNAGTAHLFAKNKQSAIKNLTEALALKPDDLQAAHNLKLAEELQAEEPPPQEEQKPKDDPKQEEDKNKEDPAQKEQDDAPNDNSQNKSPPEPQAAEKEEQESKPSGPETEMKNEESKEKNQDEEAPPSPENQTEDENASPEQAKDVEAPNSQETEAWLESLDDSPIIVRPQRQRRRAQGGQTW